MLPRADHSLESLFSEIQEMKEEHFKTQRAAAELSQARAGTIRDTQKLQEHIKDAQRATQAALTENARLDQELAECKAHNAFLRAKREELSTTRGKLEVEKHQLQQAMNASRSAFKRTMHAVYAEGKVIVSSMGNAAATQKELEHIAQEISTVKDRCAQIDRTLRARKEAEQLRENLGAQLDHLLRESEGLRAAQGEEEAQISELESQTEAQLRKLVASEKISGYEKDISVALEELYYLRDLAGSWAIQKDHLEAQERNLKQHIAQTEMRLDAMDRWQPAPASVRDEPVSVMQLMNQLAQPVAAVASPKTTTLTSISRATSVVSPKALSSPVPSRAAIPRSRRISQAALAPIPPPKPRPVAATPATPPKAVPASPTSPSSAARVPSPAQQLKRPTPFQRRTFSRIFLDEELALYSPAKNNDDEQSKEDEDLLAPHW